MGTDAQLIKVLELHRDERRLDELVFKAWWHGLDVQRSSVRDFLVEQLNADRRALKTVTRRGDDFAWVDTLGKWVKTSRHPLMQWVRTNLKRGPERDEDIVTVLVTVLAHASGFDHETEDDEDVIELATRGIGLQALTEPIAGEPPVLDQPPNLRESIAMFTPSKVHRDLLDSSDEELDAARDDARFLAYDVSVFVRAARALFGRRVLGLGWVLVGERGDRRGWEYRRIFASVAVRLRKMGLGKALDEFKEVIRETLPRARAFLAQRGAGYK
jgi:hypothetical protein